MKYFSFINISSLIILLQNFIQILSQTIKINTETNQFIDNQGRELFFHGVNVVYKIPPWIPDVDKFDPLTSFNEDDMQFLKDMGLNIIRLGVEWAGVEPTRGQYNETYIQIVKSIVEKSKTYGIYTLLDFHQDILSEKFCGEGIPKWAVKPSYFTLPFPIPSTLLYKA